MIQQLKHLKHSAAESVHRMRYRAAHSSDDAPTIPPPRRAHPGELPIPSSSEESTRSRSAAAAELISLCSALYAFPTVLVSSLSIPVASKIFWLACLIVPVALITWFIRDWPNRTRRPGWRRARLAALPIAACASIVIAFFAAQTVESNIVPSALLGCVSVGAGNQQYAQQFQTVYDAAGGHRILGCAITVVVPWVGGFVQTLQGPAGQSVIAAVPPNRAFILDPDEFRGFVSIDRQGTAFAEAGFPTSREKRLRNGWEVDFGQGDQYQPSAMLKRKGTSNWYWVSPSFWAKYSRQLGGPDGKYGYPISQQMPLGNGFRQYFQHGWLFYQANLGVLTSQQYALYKEGNLHCSPSSGPGEPSAPPRALKVANTYHVDSNHGTSYPLRPNQFASQPFRPRYSYIDEIGVIVGWDPSSGSGNTHSLKVELVTSGGRVLYKAVKLLANNIYTTTSLPDVRVRMGQTYFIRVYNYSLDTLGVYLNDPSRPGERSTNDGLASVNGVKKQGVLSAFVEARTQPTEAPHAGPSKPVSGARC